ncbi:MAG: class I SAM-dependent methyltransferase [Alphaproteobacteria bacterium]|nr:class I SAM-dependent methyltransferase [Alphaproteobacteria bacterium]
MSNHFNRRTVMGGAAGLASAIATMSGSGPATAKLTKDVQQRGQVGRLERLPTLDLEANDEMLTSIRIFINGELSQAAAKSAAMTLKAKGLDPSKPMAREAALEALKDDPIVAVRNHSWQHLQMLMWDNLKREFHGNYDAYMSEMEAADNVGPGKLELNPGIEPEYTKHEIHMQPGGYTGDAFAGHIYHYGTNNFYNGNNYQDERHAGLAARVPVPNDGKVRRILEIGCSCGQLTVALKQRFPDAEVWGVDIGAPMVRYAHMRANDLGVAANFRHALAEDTKFPDNHFDILTSNILHHEVTRAGTLAIFKEAQRILRPGGLYYPMDFYTAERQIMKNGYGQVRDWMTSRWNHERWLYEYQSVDFPKEMTAAGFDVIAKGMPGYVDNLVAYKKA